MNPNSVEDEYFKRAVRQKGKIVVSLNGRSKWHDWILMISPITMQCPDISSATMAR